MRTAVGPWFLLLAACAGRAPETPCDAPSAPPARPAVSVSAPSPAVVIAPPSASKISYERIARWPEPGWQVPRNITFSSDGKQVTFLHGSAGGDELALHGLDLGSRQTRVLLRASDLSQADPPPSREEELRRERQRQRARGISDYSRAAGSDLLVLPYGGDVYVRQGDGSVARLTRTPEAELDPKSCATGKRVAYVRGRELYATEVATGRETQLTRGAPQGVTHGVSDFNAQEEFDERSGFFWSPTCDRIAYLEVDERQVAELPITGYRAGRPEVDVLRYPRAGQTNPRVRVKLLELATGRITDATPHSAVEPQRYFGRFVWSSDGHTLWFQSITRDQKRRELLVSDARSGTTRLAASEASPYWVEFSGARAVDGTSEVVWLRDVGGYRHLELIDSSGKAQPRALTRGSFDVMSLVGIDSKRRRAWFTSTRESPLQRQLYAVSLDAPGEPQRITQSRGVHQITLDDAARYFADVRSDADTPPSVAVFDAEGAPIAELPVAIDADFAELGLRRSEPFTVNGPSGDVLHGQVLTPRQLEPGKRYPLVLMVYGGPGVQSVLDRWSARLAWQHLADRGVVVAALDNRGTPGRGRAFEHAIYGNVGQIELLDQLAGLDYLAGLPYVDASRVGIYGHSYGGYLALHAMFRYPGRFKVGVAGSPASDLSLYDTGYTERYLGTPGEHPDWYAAANPERFVSGLRGKLMIVHALMDENVHFAGTAKLIDALGAAGKPFDLVLFPGERHGYRSPVAKRYAFQRVLEHLTVNL